MKRNSQNKSDHAAPLQFASTSKKARFTSNISEIRTCCSGVVGLVTLSVRAEDGSMLNAFFDYTRSRAMLYALRDSLNRLSRLLEGSDFWRATPLVSATFKVFRDFSQPHRTQLSASIEPAPQLRAVKVLLDDGSTEAHFFLNHDQSQALALDLERGNTELERLRLP